MAPNIENSNAARICLAFLRDSQNPDGGWGFRPGTESRVEATCWALLALWEPSRESAEDSVRVQRARDFLQTIQLADGSWPAAPSERTGCWVTSLCCVALSAIRDQRQSSAVESGLRWICDDWPSDSKLWRRILARFSSQREVAPINYSYRGWGWTPKTSSWVEPTSFAMLALEGLESSELTSKAKRRRALATSLLFDRVCPGGGWNAGNPMVYGTAGEPTVVATVWALIALRNEPVRPATTQSMDWLDRAIAASQSPASLALGTICLALCCRSGPAVTPNLDKLLQNSAFLDSSLVAAWTILAFGSGFWLRNTGARTVAA